MREVLIFCMLCLCASWLYGQNQESNWIFGFNCELTFENGVPSDQGLGDLYVTEGSASISNAEGELLFFTNGSMVYDKFGAPMPNGSEVDGHDSSTQNVLIVPQPGDTDERFYYLFSVPSQIDWEGNFTSGGLGMVLIDMQANGGLGDVIGAGEQLTNSASEMLHATWHSNGRDVWVLTHEMGSSNWTAFLVTCEGIEDQVVSDSGRFFHQDEFGSNAIGSVKLSPQGNRVAACYTQMDDNTSMNHLTYLLHGAFNNSTGEVSIEGEVLHETETNHQGYGLSFSPNGNMLYYSLLAGTCKLYQYQLNSNDVAATEVELASGGGAYANLQLAPNGVVYIARGSGSQFLSGIMNPDVAGLACNYQEIAVELSGFSSLGLPNIWMYPYPDQSTLLFEETQNLCEGEQLLIGTEDATGNTYLWSTGETTPQIFATEPGEYVLEVFNQCHLLSRWEFLIEQTDEPQLEISSSIDHPCQGEEVLVLVDTETEWMWSTGAVDNPMALTTSSEMLLLFSEGDCSWERRHAVQFHAPPELDLETQYTICDYEDLNLELNVRPGDEVFWSTGSSSPTIQIGTSGWYEVDVINVCGQENAGFQVDVESCACEVYLPNSFSPNQDGINEVLAIHSECELEDLQWIIFNRWGEKVFECSSQEQVWMGNFQHSEHYVPDGVYFYTLEYTTPKSDRMQVQGHVTLLR